MKHVFKQSSYKINNKHIYIFYVYRYANYIKILINVCNNGVCLKLISRPSTSQQSLCTTKTAKS